MAGLLGLGAFFLVSKTGQPSADVTRVQDAPVSIEPAVETATYFLADVDFSSGAYALILYGMGEEGADVVVSDVATLRGAQVLAKIDLGDAFTLGDTPTAPDHRILSLYQNDTLLFHIACPRACAQTDLGGSFDLAGLRDAAQPLVRIEDTFDDYTDYLDALTFVQSESDFALLGLAAVSGRPHPVEQMVPSATVALPTFHRRADQQFDTHTHQAVLSTLVEGVLEDAITVRDIQIEDHGFGVLVDADNRRPATRAGVEVQYPDFVFYTPVITLDGTADISRDILTTLGENTTQDADWVEGAKAFIAGLGLNCTDCFDVQVRGNVYDQATVTSRTPETYFLSYYDLREAP